MNPSDPDSTIVERIDWSKSWSNKHGHSDLWQTLFGTPVKLTAQEDFDKFQGDPDN